MDLDAQTANDLHIKPNIFVHGTGGPVEVTYPKFLYNQSSTLSCPLSSQQMGLTALPPGAFLQGVSELGIPLLNDPNSGISAGAMIAPSSISSKNQSGQPHCIPGWRDITPESTCRAGTNRYSNSDRSRWEFTKRGCPNIWTSPTRLWS